MVRRPMLRVPRDLGADPAVPLPSRPTRTTLLPDCSAVRPPSPAPPGSGLRTTLPNPDATERTLPPTRAAPVNPLPG